MNLKEAVAFVVCVDYCGELKITYPRNRQYFKFTVVITAPRDRETIEFCQKEHAALVVTNAFYDDGALFNKWKALNQALELYAKGWTCLLDADILWPDSIPDLNLEIGNLYVPRRRMVRDPSFFQTESLQDFSKFPTPMENEEFAGYSQIFHTEDPHVGTLPWHDLNWRHAGGADSFFWMKWPEKNRIRPPFEVLHLGEDGKNWAGRVTPTVDGRILEGSEQRREELKTMIMLRRGRTRTSDRYQGEKL